MKFLSIIILCMGLVVGWGICALILRGAAVPPGSSGRGAMLPPKTHDGVHSAAPNKVSRYSDDDMLEIDSAVLTKLRYSMVGKFSKLTSETKALFGLSNAEVTKVEILIAELAAEVSDPGKMQIVDMYQGDDSSAFLVESLPENEVIRMRNEVKNRLSETLGEGRGQAFFERFSEETDKLPLIRGFGSKEMLLQFPIVPEGAGMNIDVTILSDDPEVPGRSIMFPSNSIPKPFDKILKVEVANEDGI